MKQADIKQTGQAIECRIYAEDPDQNFMPSIGRIDKIGTPTLRDVRLDCGFSDGSSVGVNYDPMLAKLIVWGEDREVAIQKTILSLDEVLFLGVKTNRDYLKRILAHSEFISGKTHTHFIPDHREDLLPQELSEEVMAEMIAAFSFAQSSSDKANLLEKKMTPWMTLSGFRN